MTETSAFEEELMALWALVVVIPYLVILRK